MQRVAVTTQCADGEAMIRQLHAEVLQSGGVVEHGELAMRVSGVVAGAELHGIDALGLQLLQYVVKRKLRQQRCEYSDSHGSPRLYLCSADRIARLMATITTENAGITSNAFFSLLGSPPAIAPMMRELTARPSQPQVMAKPMAVPVILGKASPTMASVGDGEADGRAGHPGKGVAHDGQRGWKDRSHGQPGDEHQDPRGFHRSEAHTS